MTKQVQLFSRRDFLRMGAVVSAGSALGPLLSACSAAQPTATVLETAVFSLSVQQAQSAQANQSSIPLEMGYWEQDGIDTRVVLAGGTSESIQQLITNVADCGGFDALGIMNAVQKGGEVKAVYQMARTNILWLAVLEDSPITDVAELTGKQIGVTSMASGGVGMARSITAGAGLDPENDVTLVEVGFGAEAAAALTEGKVAALSMWDAFYADLENRGLNLRYFYHPQTELFLGFGQAARTSSIQEPEERKLIVGVNRGMAKATIFAITNPEASVRIHWKWYPETKPLDIDEETALRNEINILNARLDAYRVEGRDDPRWGGMTDEQWEFQQDFYFDNGLISEKRDVGEYYSTELLDEINDFDQQAVIDEAKNWDPASLG